jgi:hypothetical protein
MSKLTEFIFGKPETILVGHYTAHFKTVDGESHVCSNWKYIDTERLLVSPRDYLTGLVKADGYLIDDDDISYPFTNIISIKWELDDTKETIKEKYQIFY